MKKNPAMKHGGNHSNRQAEAQSRPGLRSTMKQGATPRSGDSKMVGDTRALMHNGGKTPRVAPRSSKLAGIMCQ